MGYDYDFNPRVRGEESSPISSEKQEKESLIKSGSKRILSKKGVRQNVKVQKQDSKVGDVTGSMQTEAKGTQFKGKSKKSQSLHSILKNLGFAQKKLPVSTEGGTTEASIASVRKAEELTPGGTQVEPKTLNREEEMMEQIGSLIKTADLDSKDRKELQRTFEAFMKNPTPSNLEALSMASVNFKGVPLTDSQTLKNLIIIAVDHFERKLASG